MEILLVSAVSSKSGQKKEETHQLIILAANLKETSIVTDIDVELLEIKQNSQQTC